MEKMLIKKEAICAKIAKQEEALKKSKEQLKAINAELKAAEKKAAKNK